MVDNSTNSSVDTMGFRGCKEVFGEAKDLEIWGPRIWFLLTPCCSGVSTRCWETWKWLESALSVGFAYRVVDLFIRAVLSGFEGAWGVVSTLLAQIWYGLALVRCGCRWLPFLCLDVSAREWSSSALKGVLWTLFLKSASVFSPMAVSLVDSRRRVRWVWFFLLFGEWFSGGGFRISSSSFAFLSLWFSWWWLSSFTLVRGIRLSPAVLACLGKEKNLL
ncbi:BnaC04g19680D [Brassica napus]|uniref:Transmembrane protein n=3 Tax=Brassica TaxID=3705 RepID=A0A3P6BT63_BRAOL|nr:unnamed protein product [Brassica napus]CDY08659.1 BnaC04g19680D [Brassica napus]VDD08953.1 unnamed protein product [Brassica oleracea]